MDPTPEQSVESLVRQSLDRAKLHSRAGYAHLVGEEMPDDLTDEEVTELWYVAALVDIVINLGSEIDLLSARVAELESGSH